MYSEHPQFNYFDNNLEFLKNGCHIGRIDLIHENALPMILKGFPQLYTDEPWKYSSSWYVNFDVDVRERLYVNFEADSLIYTYDKQGAPLVAYGRQGRDIEMDYIPVGTWKEMKNFQKNRKEKGRYSWLEYIDDTGYLFRSYIKGEAAASDGLQIYKDGILVADVDVPKNFRVTGYIAPYYYSQVFEDEGAEKLTICRFKL